MLETRNLKPETAARQGLFEQGLAISGTAHYPKEVRPREKWLAEH